MCTYCIFHFRLNIACVFRECCVTVALETSCTRNSTETVLMRPTKISVKSPYEKLQSRYSHAALTQYERNWNVLYCASALPSARMRSEGYLGVAVSVCSLINISPICPENDITYSTGKEEGQTNCVDFFETGPLQRCTASCLLWLSVQSAILKTGAVSM